jgi:hypothetical protein
MSNYTIEKINDNYDIHVSINSDEGGIYNKCEIMIDYGSNIATIFYPSSHGINDTNYFTNSQSIDRPTTKITNIYSKFSQV